MPPVQRANPEALPAPQGSYAHLSIVSGDCRVATFSGHVSTAATVDEQTHAVFLAIAALLSSQGSTPVDLVKTTTYLVGRENLAAFTAARATVFADWFPGGDTPANTVVLVAGLVGESMLVEVDGSFVCPPHEQAVNTEA